MPLSPDDFDSHAVWNTGHEISKLFGKVSPRTTGNDTQLEEVLQWIRLALADVRSARNIESWRFPSASTVLDELNDGLESVKTGIIEINPEEVASSISTLMTSLDEVTTALMKCPLHLVPKERAEEAKVAMEEHRKFLHETLGELKSSVSEVGSKAEELEIEIDGHKTHIESQVKRLDGIVDDQGKVFAGKTLEWQKESDKATAHLMERGEGHIAEIRAMEKQSQNLVSSTARWTISTDYGIYARNQSFAAWFWSALSMLTLLGGFVWISDVIQKFENNGSVHTLMTESLLKFTVTSILVVAAGFMMKSAAGHRSESRDAKRTQLDLNALEPFIQEMTEEDKASMRIKFARKIFGRPMANSKTDSHYPWESAEEPRREEAPSKDDALDKVKPSS